MLMIDRLYCWKKSESAESTVQPSGAPAASLGPPLLLDDDEPPELLLAPLLELVPESLAPELDALPPLLPDVAPPLDDDAPDPPLVPEDEDPLPLLPVAPSSPVKRGSPGACEPHPETVAPTAARATDARETKTETARMAHPPRRAPLRGRMASILEPSRPAITLK
jgi:hypothetical protein